jgi:hypothetical protein
MPDITQVNTYAAAVGTSSSDPFVTHFSPTSPTAQNTQFPLQKRWVDTTTSAEYILANFSSSGGVITANWIELTGGSANVETLTGNSGGAVSPSADNINMVGDSTTINIVGVPSTSTLTANVILPATAHQVLVGEISSIVGISPSTAGYVLTSNGTGADPSFKPVSSLAAFQSINIQKFGAGTSTYTPTTGMLYCIVELVGPGGGGGVALACAADASQCSVGGGGAGGGYCKNFYTASGIGASTTVVVGSGGAGGSTGAGSAGSGASTFLGMTAGAGGGGGYSSVTSTTVVIAPGGVGATATGGLINVPSSIGGGGICFPAASNSNGISGMGSGTPLGGGGTSNTGYPNYPGNAGHLGGGGGGASNNNIGNQVGGNGGDGICIVTEFIS